uniref:Uncharacterized protein n=1 Tax=Caenorhabditis japonica TaxID=281687 RepID=A0A8R1EJZ9_CAEJA
MKRKFDDTGQWLLLSFFITLLVVSKTVESIILTGAPDSYARYAHHEKLSLGHARFLGRSHVVSQQPRKRRESIYRIFKRFIDVCDCVYTSKCFYCVP